MLQVKKVAINWLSGSWKTLLAVFFSYFYKNVFSNFDIKWKKITKLKYKEDFDKIFENQNKKALIIDEWWNEFSSRNSMSEQNKMISEIDNTARKWNCDTYLIMQRFYSIDINLRNNFNFLIEPQVYFDKLTKTNNIQFWVYEQKTIMDKYYFNLIDYREIINFPEKMKKIWLNYDTTQMPEKNFLKKEKPKKQKNIEENSEELNLEDF